MNLNEVVMIYVHFHFRMEPKRQICVECPQKRQMPIKEFTSHTKYNVDPPGSESFW